MCVYLGLTGALLRGVVHRIITDLLDWIVFRRRSYRPTNESNTVDKNYEDRRWFHRVDRRQGQQLVHEGGNGCFLVRPSTKHPLTLSLWYNGRAFNIPIRRRDDGKYCLGTVKPNERVFIDLDEMIDYYMTKEDLLLFSRGARMGTCRLRAPALRSFQGSYRTIGTVDTPDSCYINLSLPPDQCAIQI